MDEGFDGGGDLDSGETDLGGDIDTNTSTDMDDDLNSNLGGDLNGDVVENTVDGLEVSADASLDGDIGEDLNADDNISGETTDEPIDGVDEEDANEPTDGVDNESSDNEQLEAIDEQAIDSEPNITDAELNEANIPFNDKLYDTTSTKDMVSIEEYQQYPQIYDHIDSLDIPQSYKDNLVDRFQNMDTTLKDEYDRYAPRFSIADTAYDGGAHYNPGTGEIKMNCGRDIGDERGTSNTYFHETGHAIDHIKGLDSGDNLDISAQYDMTQCVRDDLANSLRQIKDDNGCSWHEARDILNQELSRDPIASNVVSDVFGGATGNRIRGDYTYGHRNDYWNGHGGGKSPIIGAEALAGINATECSQNPNSAAFNNRFLPSTMGTYNSIMGRK